MVIRSLSLVIICFDTARPFRSDPRREIVKVRKLQFRQMLEIFPPKHGDTCFAIKGSYYRFRKESQRKYVHCENTMPEAKLSCLSMGQHCAK